MNRALERIYSQSPIFIQDFMTSIYGYKLYRERYTGGHDKYLKQLLESQWYDEKQTTALVQQKLCEVLAYAVQHVRFYKQVFAERGLQLTDIRTTSDLEKMPIITKEQVRENPTLFVSEVFKKRDLIKINTSGTTGKTLNIFVDKESRRLAYAFFTRLKMWAGISGRPKNITFAGRTIVAPDVRYGPYWRKNAVMNNYLFSSYHLSPNNLKDYVSKIREIQPNYIDSYPSSIYILAKFMKENDLSGVYPKAIITSAETLLDHQRETIQEVFKCPVYDQYGSAEQVVFVSQCEKGTYHIHPEYGIVEFRREDGTKASPGEPARLICTGFTNRAMPLIRYDIGDTAILANSSCSCGRKFPVIENIVGRTDDIIITRDGRSVGRLDPIFKGLETIKEAQIVQEDYDSISLKIVPGVGYKDTDGNLVMRELRKRLGSLPHIELMIVQSIPRSAAGKFRAVISKVGR